MRNYSAGLTPRWSERVTGNYRITFGENAAGVDLEDYHWVGAVMNKKLAQTIVHPGEILREDVLPEVGLTRAAAARALGVSRQMLHDVLTERRPLSAVMCLKISRLFGSSPEMWMRLQAAYDLRKVEQNKKVMQDVFRIVPIKDSTPTSVP